MRARDYNRIVKVFANTSVSDGAGGSTLSTSQIGSSWAKIETIPAEKISLYGLDATATSIRIYVRHRNDIDFKRNDIFLQYAGNDYTINRVTEIDERRVVYEIIASRE